MAQGCPLQNPKAGFGYCSACVQRGVGCVFLEILELLQRLVEKEKRTI